MTMRLTLLERLIQRLLELTDDRLQKVASVLEFGDAPHTPGFRLPFLNSE
jgi:hypothetical protein